MINYSKTFSDTVWDNIPPNGFAICMVQEMVDVPRVEVKELS